MSDFSRKFTLEYFRVILKLLSPARQTEDTCIQCNSGRMNLKSACSTLTLNYRESDILYQQCMLHTLELLSCFEYQF